MLYILLPTCFYCFYLFGLLFVSVLGRVLHRRFGQYLLAISPILAKVHFQRFGVEIEDSKIMGGLRIMPRYGIKNKKIDFATEGSLDL